MPDGDDCFVSTVSYLEVIMMFAVVVVMLVYLKFVMIVVVLVTLLVVLFSAIYIPAALTYDACLVC